jgi:DNA polymerase III sliding clamp (beta) subunit (PCNA family)
MAYALPRQHFATALRAAHDITDVGASPSVLRGVLLRLRGDSVTVCATDGTRLIEFTFSAQEESAQGRQLDIIIPKSDARLLANHYKATAKEAARKPMRTFNFSLEHGQAVIESEGKITRFCPIDGAYPPYELAIPSRDRAEPSAAVTGIDAANLANVASAVVACQKTKSIITMTHHGQYRGIVLRLAYTVPGAPAAVGLVMPVTLP